MKANVGDHLIVERATTGADGPLLGVGRLRGPPDVIESLVPPGADQVAGSPGRASRASPVLAARTSGGGARRAASCRGATATTPCDLHEHDRPAVLVDAYVRARRMMTDCHP